MLHNVSERPDVDSVNMSLLLVFLALLCETVPYLTSMLGTTAAKEGYNDFVKRTFLGLSKLAEGVAASAQETILLTMTRLLPLLHQQPLLVNSSDILEEATRSVKTITILTWQVTHYYTEPMMPSTIMSKPPQLARSHSTRCRVE